MSAKDSRIESFTSELITARTAIASLRRRIVDLKVSAYEDRDDFDRFRAFILRRIGPTPEYPRIETADEIALRLERSPRTYTTDPHEVVRDRNLTLTSLPT